MKLTVSTSLVLLGCVSESSPPKEPVPGYYSMGEEFYQYFGNDGEYESRIYTQIGTEGSKWNPLLHYKGAWKVEGGLLKTKLDSIREFRKDTSLAEGPKPAWSVWRLLNDGFDKGYPIKRIEKERFDIEVCVFDTLGVPLMCFDKTYTRITAFGVPNGCGSICEY
jgi:hypothetical protein